MTDCSNCGDVILFSVEHFHLIIEASSEAEHYDFCSWACLKGWIE